MTYLVMAVCLGFLILAFFVFRSSKKHVVMSRPDFIVRLPVRPHVPGSPIVGRPSYRNVRQARPDHENPAPATCASILQSPVLIDYGTGGEQAHVDGGQTYSGGGGLSGGAGASGSYDASSTPSGDSDGGGGDTGGGGGGNGCSAPSGCSSGGGCGGGGSD